MPLDNYHSDRPPPSLALNRFIEDRASRRPKILVVYFVNGETTRIPNVTSVQAEPAAGALNIRCRNGTKDIAAFNANHIVGWVLLDEDDIDLSEGVFQHSASNGSAGQDELLRVNAIKEAIGEGLEPLVADDEDRFRPLN
jgi:hypothetical protein